MLDRVTLLWKRFSPLEERLLSAVRELLPTAAQSILDSQVAAITLVQRAPPSWGEICFYRRRRWRVDWGGVALFPCTDEFRLAEVRFKANGRSFRSALTCIGGHIFDFATTPGPRRVAFAPWEGRPIAVLLKNPLDLPTGARAPEPIPQAWEEFLRRHGTPRESDWQLHDAATAYRIIVGDAEYLILAERSGDEFILHRTEPPSDGFFHLVEHDGRPEPMEGSVEAVFGHTSKAKETA